MNENCIFCKLICGDIPSHTIYEDDFFRVVLDAFPSGAGHTLIIAKHHVENIYDLDDASGQHLFSIIKKVSSALKNTLPLDGLNVLQNNGACAGQTVFHFHVHLIPRYKDDHVQISWDTANKNNIDFEKIKIELQRLVSSLD